MTPEPTTDAAISPVHMPGGGRDGFQARAILVGTGIDLAALGATDRTGNAPLVVELIGSLTAGMRAGSRP